MNILELAGFHSNYGSNFIPTMEFFEKQLSSHGHRVFFIFSNKNLSDDFYFWERPFASKHPTILLDFSSLSFVKHVVNFIKRNNIDIVHAHFCPSIFVSMIKRRCRKNVLFVEHIHSCPYNNKKTFRAFLKRIRNLLFLNKKITKVCISKAMVPMVKYSFPKQNVIFCTNAIQLSRLCRSERNETQTFSILLFGYNYYVKGVDLAITATKLASEIINVHLNIVMGDNYEENVKKIIGQFGAIPDFVTILSPTHNIAELYKSNSVFLNASRSEGGSYAILEAYYCGALCVVSDVPATKESNLPGVIYFKSDDFNSLKEAILEAYSKINTYSNNTKYIEDNYSLSNWSNKMEEIMKIA